MKDPESPANPDLPESFVVSIIESVVEMESHGNRLSAEGLKRHFKPTHELAGLASVGQTIREIEETIDTQTMSGGSSTCRDICSRQE